MNIGFEAKRAFTNSTGLGHYSRTLISSLAQYFPEEEYFLFTPKLTNKYDVTGMENVQVVTPHSFPSTLFKSIWRSNLVKKDVKALGIDVYHGLSHEIPQGFPKTGIASAVTIHDLIFERYPKQFNPIDVKIYRHKFEYACKNADKVIAISQQTKQDIIDYYKIPAQKIAVCYQSCNPSFNNKVSEAEKQKVKQRYQLPGQFFLYVGSIIARKNLMLICEAYAKLKDQLQIPLVVIGDGGAYKKQVKAYLQANKIEEKIIFLNENDCAQSSPGFKNSDDFPAIYQQALAMVYPSTFEGFGIPVLEALCSSLPVITTNLSCMPETGGDAAYYVDGHSVDEMAKGLLTVANDEILRQKMVALGLQHAKKFTPQICAQAVMKVYESLV